VAVALGPRVLVAAMAALLLAPVAAAQARFFSAAPDVPLPAGGVETAAAVTVGTSEGQAIISFATVPQSEEAVLAFYEAALPELGWTPARPGAPDTVVYVRGREQLSLTVRAGPDGGVVLRVLLSASRASSALD